MFRTRWQHLAIVAMLALMPAALAAQGRVVGTITGSRRQPLSDARVSLQGTRYSTATQRDGRYSIAGVPAGTYTVDIRAVGHTPSQTRGIVVAATGVSTVNATLEAAAVQLTGLVVSAFFQALISMIKIIADPLNQLPTITFWLLGGLHRVSAASFVGALVPIVAAAAVLHALRWKVNALAAGDDEARTMGIDVARVRLLLIGAATLMTASCVSLSGIVGWVGLLIPHIVRMLVGPGFAAVLPMSALLGGGFLLGIDNLARYPGTTEVPLGILTSLIGAPFFALVLARARRQWF